MTYRLTQTVHLGKLSLASRPARLQKNRGEVYLEAMFTPSLNLRRARPILLAAMSLFVSCAEPPAAQTEFVLGTVCSVNLFEKGTREAYREIFERLREIESRMSANRDDTEIAEINRNAGASPVKVHPDVIEVVSSALRFADLSGGSFDPSVGPLVRLWGIGSDSARVPSRAEIEAALPLIDYRDVVADAAAGTVFLKRPGMKLDLGAIAKGYAADEAARIIAKRKIPRAIVDLGGNVLAYGEKPGKESWRIGVQDPSSERGSHIGVLAVKNKTMVTSGVYERFFEADGKRYHHILDPKTGYPVENGLLSVTIVADRSIDADGLSTSVFALGAERGRALIESLPGVEAIFIGEDFSVRATSGVVRDFQVSDPRFRAADWD